MNLLFNKKYRVLHIILNRPAKRNALTLDMSKSIVAAIDEAQTASDIGCILLTAHGAVFCAGMDLEEASDVNEEELLAAHEKLFSLGRESLKPIVMAVNGPALGGGLGLAAQSHLLYASDVATFGLPEIRVGLWPFVVYRSLSAAIGRRRVLALSLTGDYFNSSHAHEWGFVHHVSAPIEVEDHAAAMARHLARASPEAIASGLQYVREAHDKLWTEAGETAAQARRRLMATEDFAEGRLAFKQKRSPRWPSMPPDFYASK